MRRPPILGLAVSALLALAPTAGAATQTASGGGITATFTYHGRYPNYTGQTLQITGSAGTLYDGAVTDPACGTGCGAGGGGRSSVHVLDLEHNGTPDVVLDLYSGGAHCCTIEQIYGPTAAGAYAKLASRNFGDPGDELADLGHNGGYEFLTADDAFAYAFTDYAASGMPVQVLSFSGGHFHNVTKHYPHLVASDGAHWLRLFRSLRSSHFDDSTGVIAAWAADEDLLGKHVAVDKYLTAQAKAGHLNNALGGHIAPNGTKFIAALHRFLRRHGYLH